MVLELSLGLWQDIQSSRAFLVAQSVKNPPTMWETGFQSLGWEDPLEESMATHSSVLAWRIPMDRGAWRATVHRVAKSRTRMSTRIWKWEADEFMGEIKFKQGKFWGRTR